MSFSPPIYNLSIISFNRLSGKSSLCKRLIDSNVDNYQLFLSNNNQKNLSSWFYWGSIKYRRLDEKREGIFHLIEHSSINVDDKESIDNYLKRLSTLVLRIEDKISPELKTFTKDKITFDAFLCIYDISSKKYLSDFLILLHSLLKTRRPIIIITTKNDLINNQLNLSLQFEQSIHHSFPNIPIIHTSAHEHVNIQSVLELALYACDETTRKSFHTKYIPPNYIDAYKNEQSLKHVIQTEYRALLSRHVPDFRVGSWEKFYDRWQHHTTVQTFIDMFGKQQAKCLYDEHIEELRKISRQKLIDERLIPIIEMLITDQKTKLSR
jgi:GTPase SAR1 family protein